MNTVGVINPALPAEEKFRTTGEKALMSCLRWMIPPAHDNEQAAWWLHETLGTDVVGGKTDGQDVVDKMGLEWCIVRPDELVNARVGNYVVTESPTTGMRDGWIDWNWLDWLDLIMIYCITLNCS